MNTETVSISSSLRQCLACGVFYYIAEGHTCVESVKAIVPTKPNDKIKPCPFCGGDGVTRFMRAGWNSWAVECQACFATGPLVGPDDAIEKWNERKESQP